MLRTPCCAIVLAGAVSVAAQTSGSKSWEVIAKGTAKNSCVLVGNEDDLESQLSKVGWSGETNIPYIFPPLAHAGKAAKIAAVVTAADHFAQPQEVFPRADDLSDSTSRLRIHLERDVSKPNSGVFVVKLDSRYASVELEQCDAVYDDDIVASARYPRSGSSSGSSISVDSAKSDDVLVSKRAPPEVAQQHLVKETQIDPDYPSDAQKQHIQGPLTLRVEISKEGDVTDAKLVSGNPALAQAAINAVKQWKYQPIKDDHGQAIKVHTEVQVNFKSQDQGDEDDDD
jgi:TonB family protein